MKILMLHGHGQSGHIFYHKTRFFLADLAKSLRLASDSSEAVEFVFLNGPHKANLKLDSDARVWGFGDFEQGTISGLDETQRLVLEVVRTEGPFTAVIGFSTGAAIAAIIASHLEKSQYNGRLEGYIPFRFVIGFSGFKLGCPRYRSLYHPRIQTPVLHFAGTLDPVIPQELTQQLAECFSRTKVNIFEGTHHVPRSVDAVQTIIEFACDSISIERDVASGSEDGAHCQIKGTDKSYDLTIKHIDLSL